MTAVYFEDEIVTKKGALRAAPLFDFVAPLFNGRRT